MDDHGFSSLDNTPIHLIGHMLAGLLFLVLSIQVLFPKITVPIVGIFVYAISLVDFVSHEMGHLVFNNFGDFLAVLGGTAAQLFLPTVCLILTFRRKQWFTVSLFAFWVGQSLVQVSTYIRDARTQQLKLFSPGMIFGASNPIHDWHFVLDKLNLLWADQFLGWMVYLLGLSMLFSAAGLMFARAINIFPRKDQ
jgi:hypothetical protein